MKIKKSTFLLILLGSLTAIGPFSIDMYLPGFPAIAKDLKTDISHVGYSLTSFFIGISIGQLLYGPLLDKYGRKKPLLAGLSIYIIASIGCAFSPSILWLIILRFLLALGGCVGMVSARAMVRDLYSPNEVARVFSLLMLVLGISPIIAPTVGSYISANFGWRYIFIALTFISSIILIAVFKFLPETKKPNTTVSLNPVRVIFSYLLLLKNPSFVLFTIACGAASAGLFGYISGSPFIFIKLFHFSESQFGWIFGLNAAALITASQLNRLWLKKSSGTHITLTTLTLQIITSILLLLFILIEFNSTIILITLFIYLFWLGFLNPNTSALALAPFAENAGSAAAMMGSLQMIAGSVSTAFVSYFHNGTALPMAAALVISAFVGLFAVSIQKKIL